MNGKVWSRALIVGCGWLFLQCTTGTVNTATYSPAEQSAAAARVIGRFESADKSVSLEICEGNASSPAINTCQDSFQIQAQGNGKRLSDGTTSGVGCGGCPYDGVVMPVRATVARGGQSETLDGIADYGSDNGKTLDRPEVRIEVIAANGNTTGTFALTNGVMQQKTFDAGGNLRTLDLMRTGDARCPRP